VEEKLKNNFKGICHKCGKIGHKAVDCYVKKPDSVSNDEKYKGKTGLKLKCYCHNKEGHMAYQCPDKDT
jgi:hypothetical protein